MFELPNQSSQEVLTDHFDIAPIDHGFSIVAAHVELASEKNPLEFEVTLRKEITPIEEGKVISNIIIDYESDKLKSMLNQARQLQELPESERPRKLLELLRRNIVFAYNDVVEELTKTNPGLGKWIAENTGINSDGARQLRLSEIVDAGYGVCRHLSVIFLVLAKEAGLEGAYVSSSRTDKEKYDLQNITRPDTGEPLFRMTAVGQPIAGHAWVELKLSDSNWMPIDPSTNLVGDTDEDLKIFKKANYRAMPFLSFCIEGLPLDVGHQGMMDLSFLPGEAVHTGIIKINSQVKIKPLRLNSELENEGKTKEDGEWPKPTQYSGKLSFQIKSRRSFNSMNIKVLNVQFLK